MKRKLNSILLIDDDEPTNYINKLVLDELGCAKSIVSVLNGMEALDYLLTLHNNGEPLPELIFLDINMPKMNGWEFLEEYKNLPLKQDSSSMLIMLTTSLNPDDKNKSNDIDLLDGFMSKPLSKDVFLELIHDNFPNYL